MKEITKQIKSKLESLEIPFASMNIFGTHRLYIHINCVGLETANKWTEILAKMKTDGARVQMKETSWTTKRNTNTVLKPTMQKGYLISLMNG